ncbi:MAG: AAA family ATPase [candidate division KSB1 bacterium]|nr:AAA family ATPase [candidate division KSB1 bacterium]MDZ7272850.1 AAA family ATPase [candidate division KSB1 bacterium]MDZ7284127.1 AAA family ATPase [candidate division KSB1 bacterium]MDZ7297475.1 AAA family ATPase [candidate division KSB1 bacterium]MDZ7305611.1 AAA family ATPase [candidate division KSB1 bacterium]
MYRSLQLLREHPFLAVPDPRYFYAASSHRLALQRLLDTIELRRRLLVLTGDAGAGKTLLIHALRRRLPAGLATVLLLQTRFGEKKLFRRIATACGLPALPHATPADELRQLHDFLRSPRSGLTVTAMPAAALVIIDEAHHLPQPTLHDLAGLIELAKRHNKPLQFILAGAPTLLQAFPWVAARPDHATLACSSHLLSLSHAETTAYIAHRLRIAGYYDGEQLFTIAALRTIHEHSEGNPRRINALCRRALDLACREGLTSITRELVQEAACMEKQEGRFEESEIGWAQQRFGRGQPGAASTLTADLCAPAAGGHTAEYHSRQAGGRKAQAWGQALPAMNEQAAIPAAPVRPLPEVMRGWRVWQALATVGQHGQQQALRKWLAPQRHQSRQLALLLAAALNLLMLVLILQRLL